MFEKIYLSDPIATINYSDYYQYTILDIGAGAQINRLVTNGVVGLKSVLIVPMFQKSAPGNLVNNAITGNHLGTNIPSFQSPFSQTGRGTCDPLIHLTNFNVVVSGANVLQTNIKYTWEQFIEQTYGVNALNAGMLDGITSGLIDKKTPKAVQLIGENSTNAPIELFVFLEYEASMKIDKLTGARVGDSMM